VDRSSKPWGDSRNNDTGENPMTAEPTQPAAAVQQRLDSDSLWQLAQDECRAFECDRDGICDEDGMHFPDRAALLRFAALVIDRTDAERDSARAAAAHQVGKTGWPPGMLQDDSPELSKALAGKPDARLHAREAAAAVQVPVAREGWQMVPVEPTNEMTSAATESLAGMRTGTVLR
jgi:hypothetical protein